MFSEAKQYLLSNTARQVSIGEQGGLQLVGGVNNNDYLAIAQILNCCVSDVLVRIASLISSLLNYTLSTRAVIGVDEQNVCIS